MHDNDTHTILATTADPYDYVLALCCAIGELAGADEDHPPASATIRVPHWYDANGPWQLQHVGEPLPWRATREAHVGPDGAIVPQRAFAFRDDIAAVAASMLAFDLAHPFVIDQISWCLSDLVAGRV